MQEREGRTGTRGIFFSFSTKKGSIFGMKYIRIYKVLGRNVSNIIFKSLEATLFPEAVSLLPIARKQKQTV